MLAQALRPPPHTQVSARQEGADPPGWRLVLHQSALQASLIPPVAWSAPTGPPLEAPPVAGAGGGGGGARGASITTSVTFHPGAKGKCWLWSPKPVISPLWATISEPRACQNIIASVL